MFSLVPGLLAAANVNDPTNPENLKPPDATHSGLNEVLLIVCAALALGTILFLVVYLTRRKRRHRHAHHGPHLVEDSGGDDGRRVRKRRRGHPDSLPRNPTLAEAGGLPPLRPEDPSPPPAPDKPPGPDAPPPPRLLPPRI